MNKFGQIILYIDYIEERIIRKIILKKKMENYCCDYMYVEVLTINRPARL